MKRNTSIGWKRSLTRSIRLGCRIIYLPNYQSKAGWQPALLQRASCEFSRRFLIRSLLLISAPTVRNGACNEYHHDAGAAGLLSDPVLPCQGVESKRGHGRQETTI